jgi:membrane protease YdiL (CAAX protease family)
LALVLAAVTGLPSPVRAAGAGDAPLSAAPPPPSLVAPEGVSSAAVGWGNLFVPGLGATLRGDPERALIEAGTEIGLFYGGTFGVREGGFTIDTTILLPQNGSLYRPLLGLTMQEFGLKLHMYDTFYHYQQASLSLSDTESEHERNAGQPLYRGSWSDILTAPFRLKNLGNPWVFGFLLPIAAYLVYDYASNGPPNYNYRSNGTEDALYGFYDVVAEPLGSAFGEESLFRGFIQREATYYTGSVIAAILLQTGMFTSLHPEENYVPAFFGGLYFGYLTHHFDGDIEKAVACHFWVNVISGTLAYFNFRRAQGKPVLFDGVNIHQPPLHLTVGFPF